VQPHLADQVNAVMTLPAGATTKRVLLVGRSTNTRCKRPRSAKFKARFQIVFLNSRIESAQLEKPYRPALAKKLNRSMFVAT